MSPRNTSLTMVLATGNAGKVKDFQLLLDASQLGIELKSMQSFGGMPEVHESETTFAGNARLKALAARAMLPTDSAYWVLADDSGLSVDALDGAPGVQSARFAGDQATDAENREKLLSKLKGVEGSLRRAFFTCHLSLIAPDGTRHDFVGKRVGRIANAAKGSRGFGYDSLFIPEGETQTWGELPESIKNAHSHRGNAVQQMLDWLSKDILSQ